MTSQCMLGIATSLSAVYVDHGSEQRQSYMNLYMGKVFSLLTLRYLHQQSQKLVSFKKVRYSICHQIRGILIRKEIHGDAGLF